MASEFCDAKNNDCYVTLMVNWNEIKYNVAFDYKYGACRISDKTNVSFSTEFDVKTPCKKIIYYGKQNSNQNSACTNPTVTNAEYAFKFSGWKIGDNDSLTTATKFSKLTTSNGSTVNFVANWELDPNTTIKLPTVTRSGCNCYWSLTDGVNNKYDYSSGQVITSGINPNGTARDDGYIAVNLYAVCYPADIDGDRCYYNTDNSNDSDNGNLYHITTCEGGNDKPCSYSQKNREPASGKVLRKWLKGENNDYCKYEVTYDCKTNGGTTSNSKQSYNFSQTPDLSKTCSKDGWVFVGWNTNKNAHGKLNASSLTKKTQTLYAIYKKEVKTMYYDEGYGLSKPNNINLSDYSDVTFVCNSDYKTCSSTCTLYNKDSKCTAITPNIVDSRKKWFSTYKLDYTEWSDTTYSHVYEDGVFNSSEGKYYFVPHDKINGVRYKCDLYKDGDGKYRTRLDIFNISICDGKNCDYTALNGISKSSNTVRKNLSTTASDDCKAEYYATTDLNCYAGASSSTTKKATVSSCVKLSLYRTTSKVTTNGSNSWYYVPDKKCYINGSNLQSSKPNSCYSGTGGSPGTSSGSGNYHATICSNGGTLRSTGSYGCLTVYYSSMQYLHPYLDNNFYRQGCYASGAGGYTSYLDSSDNGKTLSVNWSCGGTNCYSCTNRLGTSQWYTTSPGDNCSYKVKVNYSGNCG